MAAEEHNGGGSPSDSPTKVDHSFDDLARAMAEGSISRRRALKLIAGTAIAALIPSRALADDDECVRICHVPFDRETEECDFANAQTRCVSRRERRRHLENHPCDCRGRCANCLTPACQPVGGTCSANDQCCSGRCASGMCAEPCPVDRVLLSNGTCARPCGNEPVNPCSDCAAGCAFVSATTGYCATGGGSGQSCTADIGCPSGEFCFVAGLCVDAC